MTELFDIKTRKLSNNKYLAFLKCSLFCVQVT